MKVKEELQRVSQNTKRDREERSFERYYMNGSSPWFREINMDHRTFVSINVWEQATPVLKQA
jgi:hypothetical protein